MGKIDTSEWKEFRVGELFEVKISKSVDKGGLEFAEDGEYDFIGRTPLNNGIQGTLNKLKFEANQEGTYSIAQIGMHVCQYREKKWYASQNLFVLTPFTEKSHKANKFIATVITRYLDCAYGEDTYATYPTIKTLPLLKIKLPVDKTGQPDWAYMESYMASLETKVAESLTMLQAAKDAEKKKVDTREWGEFRVGELFDAFLSKDDIQPKAIVEGNTPLVSSGKENNGIIAFIDNKNARLWEANTLTVDMFGKVFYQGQPYYAVSHGRVNILMPRMSMAKHCMQFIGCAIERVTTDKYAFSEMCTGTKLLKDVIMLPKDKTGQPDWTYMEEYMRKVEERVKVMMAKYEMTVNEAAL